MMSGKYVVLDHTVMELVEGITLKEYIERKGRLSHKEVISIAIQMCTGIGERMRQISFTETLSLRISLFPEMAR